MLSFPGPPATMSLPLAMMQLVHLHRLVGVGVGAAVVAPWVATLRAMPQCPEEKVERVVLNLAKLWWRRRAIGMIREVEQRDVDQRERERRAEGPDTDCHED